MIVNNEDVETFKKIFSNTKNKHRIYSKKSLQLSSYYTIVLSKDLSDCTVGEKKELISNDGKRLLRVSKRLKTYQIPEGIKVIADEAFSGCNIEEISIPKSVKAIGVKAFENCKKLKEIKLSKGLKSIGNYAFSGCGKLNRILIPNGVEKIGDGAFFGCSSLQTILLPESIKTLFSYVFYKTGIKGIVIPNSVEEILNSAFEETPLSHIVLPKGLKYLGCYVFKNCLKLTNIIIPEGVTDILWNTFEGCSSLIHVEYCKKPDTIGRCAFSGCKNLEDIYIPNQSFLDDTYKNCLKINHIEIPGNIKSIRGVFEGCSNLEEVFLNEGLENISSDSFNGTKIKSLWIPKSIETISIDAFRGAKCLEKLYFKSSNFNNYTTRVDIHLNSHLFNGLENLKEIHIPIGSMSIFVERYPMFKDMFIEDVEYT